MKYKKGTFVVVPNLDELSGKPSEMQIIYMWLCTFADKDGECFPGRKTLAKKSGCSIKTVDKYLKQLVEDGFISKKVRRKKDSKQNLSNIYGLLLLDNNDKKELAEVNDMLDYEVGEVQELPPAAIQNATRDSSKKDAVTIPNINCTNLTNIQSEIIEEDSNSIIIETNKVTLPVERGKTAQDRLLYLYSKLYYKTYNVSYKANWGRDKKIISSILANYSEIQISYMLCVYFNWHGMTGADSKDYDFVTGATFPIPMFKTMINKFEVYSRNVMRVPFDDDSILFDRVMDLVL
jgi:DNA-binding transcriptional regulator YhcF (GntR family)